MKMLAGLMIGVFATGMVFAQSPALLEKAKAGDINSQLQLAYNYQQGIDGPRDISQAIEWLRKAGALGSAEALYRLGTLAYNGSVLGEGVRENYPAAWACFEVAAVLGSAEARGERDRIAQDLSPAQLERAKLTAAAFFLDGEMAPKNVAYARSELAASMNAKSPQAAVMLGMSYLDPTVDTPDADKAIEYCSPVEKESAPTASLCLGRAYEMKGDERSAFKQFERAARYGVPEAMLNVAKRYHDGRGTKADDFMAAVWAMNAGRFEDAPDLYSKITANYTPDQIKNLKKKAAQIGGPVGLIPGRIK